MPLLTPDSASLSLSIWQLGPIVQQSDLPGPALYFPPAASLGLTSDPPEGIPVYVQIVIDYTRLSLSPSAPVLRATFMQPGAGSLGLGTDSPQNFSPTRTWINPASIRLSLAADTPLCPRTIMQPVSTALGLLTNSPGINEQCGNCFFGIIDDVDGVLRCRRNAPKAGLIDSRVAVDNNSRWRSVGIGDWCSDFAPAEPNLYNLPVPPAPPPISNCANCFFARNDSGLRCRFDIPGSVSLPILAGSGSGMAETNDPYIDWALVHAEDWCGQYAPYNPLPWTHIAKIVKTLDHDPTTADLAPDTGGFFRNTTGNKIYMAFNDNGTIKTAQLT